MSGKSVLIKPKLPKCPICDDGVLLMEKIELNEKAYHKSCFRCCKCKKNLTLGDFRKNNDDLYCAKHYGEIINPFLKVEVSKIEKKEDDGEEKEEDGGEKVDEKIYKEEKIDLKKKEEQRQSSPMGNKSTGKPLVFKVQSVKCQICEESVYPLEKLEVEKLTFHKTCFRCCKCKKTLSLGNFKKSDNNIYCSTHYTTFVQNPNLKTHNDEELKEDDIVKEEKVDLKKKKKISQVIHQRKIKNQNLLQLKQKLTSVKYVVKVYYF